MSERPVLSLNALYNYSAEKVKFLKQNEACCPLHHRRRRHSHNHHHRRHHRHYYQRRRRNPLMDPPSHGRTFVSLLPYSWPDIE